MPILKRSWFEPKVGGSRMRRRALAHLSFAIMNLSPAYVVLAVVLKADDVSGWMVLVPLFVIVMPAGIYIATRRCRRCHNLIYTAAAEKRGLPADRAKRAKPYRHCPTCGVQL